MQKKFLTLFMLGAAVLNIALTGCSSVDETAPPSPAPQSVTGVAATGAPIVGAVSLRDSSEPAQARTATTADNGSFTVDVTGLRPPFVLHVEWTDITGHHRMYSFAEEPGRANINPFSNVVFAGAAGISEQVLLATDLDPALARTVAARHRSVAESLRTALAPLFELYQVAQNPITDEFEADHTGLDAMFDDVRIFVNSGAIVVRNRRTSEEIFRGPIDNVASGTFYPDCMPNRNRQEAADGAALYAAKCSGCHYPLATSEKSGATFTRIDSAIKGNAGNMGYLSTLTTAEIQAIADALATTSTPPPPGTTPAQPDGAALYANNCSSTSCHGQLAMSNKKGATVARIDSAISRNAGGMGYLSTLTAAEIQAIVDALATTPAPPSTPPTTPSQNPPDGAVLYANNCSSTSCHGQLATSSKKGVTVARIDSAISGNTGQMGYLSTLTAAEIQAIVDALATTPTSPSTPPTTPAPTDGETLYASWCGSCHGVLAESTVGGKTDAQIQSAITGNTGNMGTVGLRALTTTEIQAIATALSTIPTQTPACGSCHTIPPANGRHTYHARRATCADCHGTGYSTTTVNSATHYNGVINITSTIGWNAATGTCANRCHGTERW